MYAAVPDGLYVGVTSVLEERVEADTTTHKHFRIMIRGDNVRPSSSYVKVSRYSPKLGRSDAPSSPPSSELGRAAAVAVCILDVRNW